MSGMKMRETLETQIFRCKYSLALFSCRNFYFTGFNWLFKCSQLAHDIFHRSRWPVNESTNWIDKWIETTVKWCKCILQEAFVTCSLYPRLFLILHSYFAITNVTCVCAALLQFTFSTVTSHITGHLNLYEVIVLRWLAFSREQWPYFTGNIVWPVPSKH